MAKVFDIEKFVSDVQLQNETVKEALETGWPQRKHGKPYDGAVQAWTSDESEVVKYDGGDIVLEDTADMGAGI